MAREKVAYSIPQILGSVPERAGRALKLFDKFSIGEGGLGSQFAGAARHLRSKDRLETFDRYEKELDKDYERLKEQLKRQKAKREERSLEQKVAVIIGLGILIGGLYYLFSEVSITGGVVKSLSSISSGFLVSFILVCVLGLVGYFYMKE